MRRRGLHAAVAKLEMKRRHIRRRAPIILGLYPDEGGGEVVGLALGLCVVERREECMTAFAHRAAAVLGGARIMFAVHAELEPEPAPDDAPKASAELI